MSDIDNSIGYSSTTPSSDPDALYEPEYSTGVVSQARVRDAVSRVGSSKGELSKAATNAFYGFNHRNVGAQVKPNSDNHGLTFITRPRLNLSYDNIAGVRTFAPLMTDDANTLPHAIRCILDPVSHKGTINPLVGPNNSLIIDPQNPFIAILTNLLVSVSGWPDSVMDTHTSPNGIAKESWSMIDSLPVDYTTNDITMNFRNISGDPLTLLMHIWTQYSARVCEGSMMPWPEAIAENEKDYDCRIYRMVLDPQKKFITKFAACGYGVPYVNPLGADFNYDAASPTIQDNMEKSIPFKCSGFIFNDPILVIEFNSLVAEFNESMRGTITRLGEGAAQRQYISSGGHLTMIKLLDEEKDYFNYNSYPRIAEDGSMELEWYVNYQEYTETITNLENFNPSQYII